MEFTGHGERRGGRVQLLLCGIAENKTEKMDISVRVKVNVDYVIPWPDRLAGSQR